MIYATGWWRWLRWLHPDVNGIAETYYLCDCPRYIAGYWSFAVSKWYYIGTPSYHPLMDFPWTIHRFEVAPICGKPPCDSWLVTWNILGISSSQLTNSEVFQRGGEKPSTSFCKGIMKTKPGWWFGTFFIFPHIWNNHPNWLIFFRGVQTTNQKPLVKHPQWVLDGVTSMAISFTADESPNPETPASEKYAVGDVRSSKRGGPAGRANVLDVSNISFGCVIGCVIYVYVHIYI